MNYFVKAKIEEIDISAHITSFSFEDCIKEDDMVAIELQGFPLSYETTIKAGAKLTFQFGYYGGLTSALRIAKIQDIEYKYSDTLGISITALDEGQVMKKEVSKQVWVNKTASQIATEIAGRYGLKTDKIETTGFVYENLPQANRSDMDLLQYLAKREDKGSYRCFIKDNALVFSRLALEQESVSTLHYGKHIVSFDPKFEDTSNDIDSKGIELATFDPISQSTLSQNIGAGNATDYTKMGSNDNAANKSPKDRKPTSAPQKYNANGNKI